ncbi:MAG: NAD(P)H-hydrate dehydratase [Saprospiraceae bacterium]|nr:NAD(P)H-hydrate dehydratase [Saprospiraceae bacterium]
MIPVLSREQIRHWDAFTIRHQGISSYDLMEQAVHALSKWIMNVFPREDHPIVILCGPGNNGGDGLGLARHLFKQFYDVTILDLADSKTEDRQMNYDRLPSHEGLPIVRYPAPLPARLQQDKTIWIDALLGSGCSGPLKEPIATLVRQVNTKTGIKLAIDLPSGLQADKPSTGPIYKADITLTFQAPKFSFFISENERFVGHWHLLDIGLVPAFLRTIDIPFHVLTSAHIRHLLHTRSTFSHKGMQGHVCLISGRDGMMGAAILSGRAALRSGAGKLTLYAPHHAQTILQIGLPEALYMGDPHETVWSTPPPRTGFQSAGVGCGIGTNQITAQALRLFLESTPEYPLVLDADALNILADDPTLMSRIPPGSILTPHPGEMQRLIGERQNAYDQINSAIQLARKHQIYIILKGAYTRIICPDGTGMFNSTGNAGMATAGSGDVLTGLLAGLLAQGYPPGDAAQIGVFIHGLAGDLALVDIGAQESILASDLVDQIGHAFQKLKGVCV